MKTVKLLGLRFLRSLIALNAGLENTEDLGNSLTLCKDSESVICDHIVLKHVFRNGQMERCFLLNVTRRKTKKYY